jgi:hypothetical protein
MLYSSVSSLDSFDVSELTEMQWILAVLNEIADSILHSYLITLLVDANVIHEIGKVKAPFISRLWPEIKRFINQSREREQLKYP